MMGHEGMNLDHDTIPAGHKSSRRRGWRVALLRQLAASKKQFTARELMRFCNHASDDSMTILQAQALCSSYVRKKEIMVVRRGIGGPDSVEAIYQLTTKANDAKRDV